jgi:hypothetical protein
MKVKTVKKRLTRGRRPYMSRNLTIPAIDRAAVTGKKGIGPALVDRAGHGLVLRIWFEHIVCERV